MKRVLFIISMAVVFVTSCTKPVREDPADRFVGMYSFTDTYFMTWGTASSSFNDSGTFMITKLGPSEVQISKPWGTTATVLANQLNINSVTQSDNAGYINFSFSSASIAGDMLTINYQGIGSLKYSDGRSYPYSCQGHVIATKNK